MVVLNAAHGRASHVRPCKGRLLAVQDGVGQVHGDEVREARNRDLRQLVGGAQHVQGGTDAESGVVQQPESLPCHLRPAGHRLQLGGIAQCHHRSLGTSPEIRGPLVDREQPLAREVHLVGGLTPGGEQRLHLGIEARQVRDELPLDVRGQLQQPSGLVVRQHQPPVGGHDQHPFPNGVEHRVVVLVHQGHLVRGQAVCLASQPLAHQRRHTGGQHERSGPGAQDDR